MHEPQGATGGTVWRTLNHGTRARLTRSTNSRAPNETRAVLEGEEWLTKMQGDENTKTNGIGTTYRRGFRGIRLFPGLALAVGAY